MRRRWLTLGVSLFAFAALGGASAIALAGNSDGGPPPGYGAPDPNNPASFQPGYPAANNHGPNGEHVNHHDPNEIGPCGKRWGDVYVDPETGGVTISEADTTDGSGHGCHVLTKAELDHVKQMFADENARRAGAPPGPAPAGAQLPTSSTTTP